MAYDQFDETNPTSGSPHATVWDEIRLNDIALSHMIGMGLLVGWDGAPTIGGGSAQKPDSYTYTNNGTPSELVRMTFTYGSSGVMLDLIEVVLIEHSINAGAAWDTVGTVTLAMTEKGSYPSVTWS